MTRIRRPPEPVRWQDGVLHLLDQRLLPDRVEELVCVNGEDVHAAIRGMAVRGAPAIGIAAAWGTVVEMRRLAPADRGAWLETFGRVSGHLAGARPTAVNLRWAMQRLEARVASTAGEGDALMAALEDEARAIHDEDRLICRGIAEHGQALITPGCGILTHCNAGALAVSELGTALAPMYRAHERGLSFRVYADETRPVLQGARLTAWELDRAGIDVTLICDSMAAHLMASGAIDLVLVGTDRVTANGDVVNKIGTLGVAILARHFDIPFYVACPSSTYDPGTNRGIDVEIEERDAEEVTRLGGRRIAPEGIAVRNPAFDVTPAELVSGIVTEHGIARPPLAEQLAALLAPG